MYRGNNVLGIAKGCGVKSPLLIISQDARNAYEYMEPIKVDQSLAYRGVPLCLYVLRLWT